MKNRRQDMRIDCDVCAMRNTDACTDCVVTFLLAAGPVELNDAETEALGNLAEVGLVPRLRLIPRKEEESASG
jgi:hypothetical protein